MNMLDILNFFRILDATAAFFIAVCSLKKSNENPVFKPIAYLAAMLGFWNLIRFFLLQTQELQLSFIMIRAIYVLHFQHCSYFTMHNLTVDRIFHFATAD